MPFIDAKPFKFQFDFDHVALICIDMQRDFCEPGGFAESLGNNIANILATSLATALFTRTMGESGVAAATNR